MSQALKLIRAMINLHCNQCKCYLDILLPSNDILRQQHCHLKSYSSLVLLAQDIFSGDPYTIFLCQQLTFPHIHHLDLIGQLFVTLHTCFQFIGSKNLSLTTCLSAFNQCCPRSGSINLGREKETDAQVSHIFDLGPFFSLKIEKVWRTA